MECGGFDEAIFSRKTWRKTLDGEKMIMNEAYLGQFWTVFPINGRPMHQTRLIMPAGGSQTLNYARY